MVVVVFDPVALQVLPPLRLPRFDGEVAKRLDPLPVDRVQRHVARGCLLGPHQVYPLLPRNVPAAVPRREGGSQQFNPPIVLLTCFLFPFHPVIEFALRKICDTRIEIPGGGAGGESILLFASELSLLNESNFMCSRWKPVSIGK
jgi:hypothetical protein